MVRSGQRWSEATVHSGASYRESIRASSPSTCSEAFGVLASRTKWLSQCGQYSSLLPISPSATREVWAGYSRVLELARILAESLFALFADKSHVKRLHEWVVALLLVAFCAVEPFFACPLLSVHGTCMSFTSAATYSMVSGWRPGR